MLYIRTWPGRQAVDWWCDSICMHGWSDGETTICLLLSAIDRISRSPLMVMLGWLLALPNCAVAAELKPMWFYPRWSSRSVSALYTGLCVVGWVTTMLATQYSMAFSVVFGVFVSTTLPTDRSGGLLYNMGLTFFVVQSRGRASAA